MENKNIISLIIHIVLSILCIVSYIVGIYIITNLHIHHSEHVHFIDTNQCFDIKRSYVSKGISYIYFDDGTEIKCSADNVVVYVNHPCDYCNWGH